VTPIRLLVILTAFTMAAVALIAATAGVLLSPVYFVAFAVMAVAAAFAWPDDQGPMA
jgi:hypothetical protein